MIQTRRRRPGRSLAAILLIFSMLLVSFSAAAEEGAVTVPILKEGETEGSGTASGSWIPSDSSGFSSEKAIRDYIRRTMYFQARSRASDVLGSRLEGENRKLYDALVKDVTCAAEGKVSEVVFERDYSLVCTIPEVHNNLDEFKAILSENVCLVFDALLHDCPSELYWFDKTRGMSWSFGYSYTSSVISVSKVIEGRPFKESHRQSGQIIPPAAGSASVS